MRVVTGRWSDWPDPTSPSSVTIGVLDGVHLGHQALIGRLSPQLTRTVLTFEPHPVEILRPGTHPRLITSLPERISRLGSLGVEQVGVLDLSEIKELSPQAFVEGVLVDRLAVGQVVVGPDFRFGKDRAGEIDTLVALGTIHGFEVSVVDLVADRSGSLSSSRIREAIEAGRLEEVKASMGARFTISNVVIPGDHRGRSIGFPTANLRPPERKVVPAAGVYAAFAHLGEESHQAAVNVGFRPTFDGEDLLIEAFLLDFDADLYGAELMVEFVSYLRPELRFGSVDELVSAMRSDVETAGELLGATRPSTG